MILVTGGAGFIGSNFVAAWEAEERGAVAVCDRFAEADKWRNVAKRELYDVVAPDDLLPWLDRHVRELELIVHMGAISATTAADAAAVVANNIRLTLDLWDWCARHGVRLIYASSAAVYGDGAAGFDDDPSPAALARLRPLNLYGWSKLMVDRRVARTIAAGGPHPPQWAGLRFFNVYGPNEYHKAGQLSIALAAFEQIRANGRCRLFRSDRADVPDGGQQRDFVWIDDCVAAMLWLADRPKVSGIFNLGSGRARSFADMARAVFAALGKPEAIDFIDMPQALRGQYQYFTQAPLARLRAAGFARPATEAEAAVHSYVEGFLARPDRYR